ncbi:MAG: beta-N-acetylhexosaminidase [Acidobacteriaceae bacterium]
MASPLFARGYTVIPQPQEVSLGSGDFSFGPDWQLKLDASVPANDVAGEALREELSSRFHLALAGGNGSGGVLLLRIAAGSVPVGKAQDADRKALEEQAYRIDMKPRSITISANAATGLFYGVETLVQLLRPDQGKLRLPEGSITDWPDLQLRQLYWDDNHHLEHVDELKRALRQAAFYKMNGFVIKLNGHFQFKSAPAVVEPYALTPAELQELTDYGLRYHIELIPYLDGPGHIAFILKHPEYAKLREFPNSNYEICATNPESYKLLEGMYQDLMDANKGVKYFYLSTDEAYYLGMAKNAQCNEADLAKKLGSVAPKTPGGQMFVHFVNQTAGYLHDKGRTVMFWGEYPMKPGDLSSLPPYMVNGEVYGPEYDREFRKRGIRQMIYTSAEGEERMFPKYFPLDPSERLHPGSKGAPRVDDIMKKISLDSSRTNADLIGEVNAGWADAGVNPETFWLGHVAGSAAGWHPGSNAQEVMSTFYSLFYGPGAVNMNRVYQMMSEQGQSWADSWDTVPSTARKPIWGWSYGIYTTPHPADDHTLPLPPVPTDTLSYSSNWTKENTRRVKLASNAIQQNDIVLGMLSGNMVHAEFNHYNLEVFLSIAYLCRQSFQMISGVQAMDENLSAAAKLRESDPEKALKDVDLALDTATSIWSQRNQVLQESTLTWEKSWFPHVAEKDGRHFLHELDDVKDHLPDRTTGLDYLVYREAQLPFGEWVNAIAAARDKFATAHHLPLRKYHLEWKDLKVASSVCASAAEINANPQLQASDLDQASTCGAGR